MACSRKLICGPATHKCVPTGELCNPNTKKPPVSSLPLKKVMNLSLKDIIDKLTGKA